jgi:hypothetical protein
VAEGGGLLISTLIGSQCFQYLPAHNNTSKYAFSGGKEAEHAMDYAMERRANLQRTN